MVMVVVVVVVVTISFSRFSIVLNVQLSWFFVALYSFTTIKKYFDYYYYYYY